MSVTVYSPDPQELIDALENASQEGDLKEWRLTSKKRYTLNAEKLRNKAFFSATVSDDYVVFNIRPGIGLRLANTTYAIYHGHFIQLLLMNFDDMISTISCTALADDNDRTN
ncbi:MAG: hypothetical protein QM811_16765 [Pirellulales bacterium]